MTDVDLVNLDVAIARFIIPRLEAFADQTDSFPAEYPTLDTWRADLRSMAAAWRRVEDRAGHDASTQAGLMRFVRRLPEMWS